MHQCEKEGGLFMWIQKANIFSHEFSFSIHATATQRTGDGFRTLQRILCSTARWHRQSSKRERQNTNEMSISIRQQQTNFVSSLWWLGIYYAPVKFIRVSVWYKSNWLSSVHKFNWANISFSLHFSCCEQLAKGIINWINIICENEWRRHAISEHIERIRLHIQR